jgi:two-component system response regulator PilR (NtrC family)
MLFLPNINPDDPPSTDERLYAGPAKQILIIEDFAEIRESLAFMMRKKGYAVCEAQDGLEGWLMCQRQAFDLILTDIRMPGLNGDALVEQVYAVCPKTPMVVMTASEIDTARILFESGKVAGVLLKPFEIAKLMDIVADLCPVIDRRPVEAECL